MILLTGHLVLDSALHPADPTSERPVFARRVRTAERAAHGRIRCVCVSDVTTVVVHTDQRAARSAAGTSNLSK